VIKVTFDFLPSSTILLTRSGSHAYGMATATSDEDFRGVMLADPDMLIGLRSWDTQFERKEPDTVVYTLPKFVKLAMVANPNILDVLFCDETDVVFTTPTGNALRSLAHNLQTHVGYQKEDAGEEKAINSKQY
jgi:predicted nucleotidyltransferase